MSLVTYCQGVPACGSHRVLEEEWQTIHLTLYISDLFSIFDKLLPAPPQPCPS